MAKTKIYYEDDSETFCFICAVRRAMLSEPPRHKIKLVCDPYEFHQCKKCGQFIEDEIEI